MGEPPASGTQLKCPGCGYDTIVWEDDGHIDICPKCHVDGLMPRDTAEEVKANRMVVTDEVETMATADFDELVDAADAADFGDEPVRTMQVESVDMSVKADKVAFNPEEMKAAVEERIEELNERDSVRYPRRGETR